MQQSIRIFLIFIIAVAAVFFLSRWMKQAPANELPINSVNTVSNPQATSQPPVGMKNDTPAQNASGFLPPLDRAGERVTKKTFGLYVTPQNSPVSPEKFTGYHTGADFEIFPEELNATVSVRAVCAGKLVAKEYATGYGGVAVESCNLNGQPITVIYGHLKLASINTAQGGNLAPGDVLGVLGAAYSQETSGERKHLHLGFHKGTAVDILGYVQNKADLSGWIDPCLYVCHN